MPEEIRTEKHQSAMMIMKESQAKMALNGQPEAEGDATEEAEYEQTKEEKNGVLTRRAHPPELTQYLEVWQLRTNKERLDAMMLNDKVQARKKPLTTVFQFPAISCTDVENELRNLSDLINSGVDQLKASMRNDLQNLSDLMNSGVDQLKESKKKTRNQGNLINKMMVGGITRFSLGGISAVGRTKVDKKITAQEHNKFLMVFFHLDQTVCMMSS